MYFVVINIPQTFHAIDLRNYFSEFIEKETFNCFHFRHRIQSQLVDLIEHSAVAPTNSGVPVSDDKTTDEKRSEASDTVEGTSQIGESSFSKLPDTQAEKQNDGESPNPNTDSQGTTSLKTSSQETTGRESNSQETTCLEASSQRNIDKESDSEGIKSLKTNSQGNTGKERNSPKTTSLETSSQGNTGKEGGNICSEGEVQGDRNTNGDPSTHYLNSGVADLASLKKNLKKEETQKKEHGGCILWHNPVVRTSEEKIDNEKTSNKCHNKIMNGDILFNLMVEEAPGRLCAPVDVKEEHEKTFFKKYNHKHWVTLEGDILPQRCYLLKVDFRTPSKGKAPSGDNKTQQELSTSRLDLNHPQTPSEFLPGATMPHGNVGTSTQRFHQLVRTCQASTMLLKRLGMEYTRNRKGKTTQRQEDTKTQVEGDIAFTAAGHLIPSSADFEEERKRRMKDKGMLPKDPKMKLEEKTENGQNGPEMQKLQQNEPFHEDITLQARIKERHFEEALEMMWEEGGPGLVFYTNPRLWWGHEQTPKQWPVGDEDEANLQHSVSKRKKERGKGSSRAAKKEEKRNRKALRASVSPTSGPKPTPTISSFETHIKDFDGQIITAQGLQEHQRLGGKVTGMPPVLESNGQHSHKSNGLGFANCSLPHNLKGRKGGGKGSPHGAKKAKRWRKNAPSASGPTPQMAIGSFEAHTKGIGRRIMEALGWKEGQGLGKELAGRPYAIECNGQQLHGRKGIGFHGKKLQGGASTTSTTTGKPQPPNTELNNHTQISATTAKLQPPLADLSQHIQTSGTTDKLQPLQANLSKPFNFTVLHHAEDAQPSAPRHSEHLKPPSSPTERSHPR